MPQLWGAASLPATEYGAPGALCVFWKSSSDWPRMLLLQSDMVTAISAHQLHYEIEAGSLVVLDFPLDKTQRQLGVRSAPARWPRRARAPWLRRFARWWRGNCRVKTFGFRRAGQSLTC